MKFSFLRKYRVNITTDNDNQQQEDLSSQLSQKNNSQAVDENLDKLIYFNIFVSKLCRKLLYENRPLQPCSIPLFGAVLFADISGFTQLSNQLSLDELKFKINEYFTMLIRIIDEIHGDIVKFCGDAIIVVWPISENANQAEKACCVDMATSCSLELLNESKELLESGKSSLSLHCGISCGTLHCMLLGRAERWEFVVSGACIKEIGDAVNCAKSGEVCISHNASLYISDRFNFSLVSTSPQILKVLSHMEKRTFSYFRKFNSLSSDDESFRERVSDTPASPKQNAYVSDLLPNSENSNHVAKSFFGLTARKAGVMPINKEDSFQTSNIKSFGSPLRKPNASKSDVWDDDVVNYLSDFPLIDLESICKSSYLKQKLTKLYSATDVTDYCQSLCYFQHEATRSYLKGRAVNYISELRPTVTIFIEILGLEDDFILGLVDRPQLALKVILEGLEHHGGMLRQYVFDDKGCIAIGGFGLSGCNYENNCARAIEVAASVRRRLKTHEISCCIGITKGKTYCGPVGSSSRCEFVMMGPSVNLAARLMKKAAQYAVLVNEDIYEETKNQFEFIEHSKIQAKGYTKLVSVFTPTERTPLSRGLLLQSQGERETLFIGRSEQLNQFEELLDNYTSTLQRGENSKLFLQIRGVQSVGKSRTIGEFQKIIMKNPMVNEIFVACGNESHFPSRFFILRQLLDQIFQMEKSSILFDEPFSNYYLKQRKLSSIKVPRANSIDDLADEGEYLNKIIVWMKQMTELDLFEFPTLQELSSGVTQNISETHEDDIFSMNESGVNVPNFNKSGYESFDFDCQTFLPLLSEILPIPYKVNDHIASFSPIMKWEACEEIIFRILRCALGNLRNVLIVENLQWCDQPSLKLLFRALKSIDSGCFISTIRFSHNITCSNRENCHIKDTFDENTNVTICSLSVLSQTIDILPFTEMEVTEMAGNILGQRILTMYPNILCSANIQEIIDRTNGLPYLVQTLCCSMRDAILKGQFTGIEAMPRDSINIILSRYDQLTETDQLILKSAAIIGETFTLSLVKRVLLSNQLHDVSKVLTNSLSLLTDSSLINQVDIPGEKDNTYTFNNSSIRHCILSLMLKSDICSLHNVVGTILEKEFEDKIADNFSVVANHFFLSDNIKKKIEYLEISAYGAYEQMNHRLFCEYSEKLISIVTERSCIENLMLCIDELSLNCYQQNAEVGNAVGGLISNSGALRRQLLLSRMVENIWLFQNNLKKKFQDELFLKFFTKGKFFVVFGDVAESYLILGRLTLSHNMLIVALAGINKQFAVKGDKLSCLPLARPQKKLQSAGGRWFTYLTSLATLYILRGQATEALTALKMAQGYPPNSVQLEIRWNLLYGLLLMLGVGDKNQGITYLSKARSQMARENCDAFTYGIFWLCEGAICVSFGNFRSAHECVNSATTYFRNANMVFLKYMCIIYNCWICLFRGNIKRAKRCICKIEASIVSLDIPCLRKWYYELASVASFLEGDYNQVLFLLETLRLESRMEIQTPTYCVLLCITHVFLHGNCNQFLPQLRYCCKRLAMKTYINPVNGVLLYFAGHCALQTLSTFKITTSNSKQIFNELTASAKELLASLKLISKSISCLRVLNLALEIFSQRIIYNNKPIVSWDEKIKSQSAFDGFLLAQAFLYHQLAAYYRSFGAESNELKATECESLSKQLFVAMETGEKVLQFKERMSPRIEHSEYSVKNRIPQYNLLTLKDQHKHVNNNSLISVSDVDDSRRLDSQELRSIAPVLRFDDSTQGKSSHTNSYFTSSSGNRSRRRISIQSILPNDECDIRRTSSNGSMRLDLTPKNLKKFNLPTSLPDDHEQSSLAT